MHQCHLMLKLTNYGLLLLTMTVLVSCKNDDAPYTAYLEGKISNLGVNYIILSKDNRIIDTLYLDEENHFYKKFDSLAPGLYSFKHEPDYQYVYFEKNDSINLTFDAVNFNESLTFNGRGSEKNNFMMQEYLANESDNTRLRDIYNDNNTSFLKTAGANYKSHLESYTRKKKKLRWSKDFDFYAKARLDFEFYTQKEHYPYVHELHTHENIRKDLPENYYAYRKDISFNDPRLLYFSPFTRYLNAMLTNMAFAKKYDNSAPKDKSLRENIEKLRIADSVFTDERIKNVVLDNIAFAYILEDRNIENNEQFLDEYVKLSSVNDDNEIKKMGKAIKLLKPGKEIPAIALTDDTNKSFSIAKDLKKETVVFFWTACARIQLDIVQQKVIALRKSHPEVNFIAINIDDTTQWKRMLDEYHFRGIHPLHAENFDELKYKWVFTKINRTIILNPDGTIKNAFTNLMDPKFTEFLK